MRMAGLILCELDVSGKFLASFDVVSLFTNIPLKETIDIIVKELFLDPTRPIECPLFGNDSLEYKTHFFMDDLKNY